MAGGGAASCSGVFLQPHRVPSSSPRALPGRAEFTAPAKLEAQLETEIGTPESSLKYHILSLRKKNHATIYASCIIKLLLREAGPYFFPVALCALCIPQGHSYSIWEKACPMQASLLTLPAYTS